MKSELVIFVETSKLGTNTGEVVSSEVSSNLQQVFTRSNGGFTKTNLM